MDTCPDLRRIRSALTAPEIDIRDGQAVYEVGVHFDNGSSLPLWYRVPKDYGNFLSDRADAAAIALLLPAMQRGEPLHLEGVLSEELAYQLRGDLQDVIRIIIPTLHVVDVSAKEVAPADECIAKGVATGFSGGIDSFAVMADHYYGDVPEGFRITHLLFNNVGAHGSKGASLFWNRFERLQPLASRFGLPMIPVDSNVVHLWAARMPFIRVHTVLNASVPLLLQNGLGRFFYASAYSYRQVFVGETSAMARADPVLLPLLSTRSMQLLSIGSAYTRTEKTMMVADLRVSHDSLNVCVRSANNCSRCWKCLRTLLTLEIGGVLDRYVSSFDMAKYQNERQRYMASVLASREPFSRELVEFANDRAFNFPFSARWRAVIARAEENVRRLAPVRVRAAVQRVRQHYRISHNG